MVAATVFATTAFGRAQPPEADAPRYLAVVRHELERVGVSAACEPAGRARGECTFTHGVEGSPSWPVRVVVSEARHAVTLIVDELGRIPPGEPSSDARLRHLAELNWSLDDARLEWNPRTGAVRLSTMLRTDTNFDRRAFRVALRLLLSNAERLAPQLQPS